MFNTTSFKPQMIYFACYACLKTPCLTWATVMMGNYTNATVRHLDHAT